MNNSNNTLVENDNTPRLLYPPLVWKKETTVARHFFQFIVKFLNRDLNEI